MTVHRRWGRKLKTGTVSAAGDGGSPGHAALAWGFLPPAGGRDRALPGPLGGDLRRSVSPSWAADSAVSDFPCRIIYSASWEFTAKAKLKCKLSFHGMPSALLGSPARGTAAVLEVTDEALRNRHEPHLPPTGTRGKDPCSWAGHRVAPAVGLGWKVPTPLLSAA